jgi:hypothetical protein
MGKQTFDRIKKTLGILLIVISIVSLTAGSVSAVAGSGGKTISSVAGKSSVTASDPPSYSVGFSRHYGSFDRDFHRDFDRDFNRHFNHFRDFDRDDFDRHFREFHRDFDRDFHGDFDRHFHGY